MWLVKVTNGTYFQNVICSFGHNSPFKIQAGSPMYTYFYFLLIFCAMMSVLTTLANALIIIIILKSKTLRTKMFYRGLVYMSLLDFFTGTLTDPVYVKLFSEMLKPNAEPEYICILWRCVLSLGMVFSGMSCNGIMFITTERFISVCYALKYKDMFTTRRAVALMIFLWMPTILVVVSFAGLHSYSLSTVFSGLIIFGYAIAVPLMYTRIFKVIRQSHKRVSNNRERSGQAMEEKIAKKFLVIIIVFALCFLPYGVVSCLGQRDDELFYFSSYGSVILVFSNSFINPVIYFQQDSRLKQELRNLYKTPQVAPMPSGINSVGATSKITTRTQALFS